jgi:hypothetical protein
MLDVGIQDQYDWEQLDYLLEHRRRNPEHNAAPCFICLRLKKIELMLLEPMTTRFFHNNKETKSSS